MKNIQKLAVLLLLVLNFSLLTFSQTPNQFKYQAVLRDANGNIIANQNKTVVIDILQSNLTTSVFSETHNVITTSQGLINLNIGSVENLNGIDWSADEYFIQITVDGTIMGTSQLLSVPYSLLAKEVENIDYSQISNLPELFDGNYNNLTNTPDLSSFLTVEIDGSVTNEIQNLDNVLTQNNSAGNKNITNLANPVNTQDAATKSYVDLLEIRIAALEELMSMLTSVTDIDGNIYPTVKIGNQIWMAEDLRVTHYPNGDAIPYIDDNETWANMDEDITDGYCVYGDNDNDGIVEETYPEYGFLYTYAAAIGDNWERDNSNGQGICPTGWHLPSNDDWTELVTYISNDGHTFTEGTALKSTTDWLNGGTDDYGFNALAGGSRFGVGGAFANDIHGYRAWWTSTQGGISISAWYIALSSNTTEVINLDYVKSSGFAVRCVKD